MSFKLEPTGLTVAAALHKFTIVLSPSFLRPGLTESTDARRHGPVPASIISALCSGRAVSHTIPYKSYDVHNKDIN